jgi:hypothetical protein
MLQLLLLLLLLPPAACSSCWAFAAAAVTEAASYAKTGVVISLSEKQLVDCNTDNGGCDGGLYPPAFEYIISKGLTTAMQYPYVSCLGRSAFAVVFIFLRFTTDVG